jgi:hypothetical protein
VGVSVAFIADIAGLDSMTGVELGVNDQSMSTEIVLTFMP